MHFLFSFPHRQFVSRSEPNLTLFSALLSALPRKNEDRARESERERERERERGGGPGGRGNGVEGRESEKRRNNISMNQRRAAGWKFSSQLLMWEMKT